MLSASPAIIPLRMLSLQPCLEFRADKFVTKTYQDLLFIRVIEGSAGAGVVVRHKTRRRS